MNLGHGILPETPVENAAGHGGGGAPPLAERPLGPPAPYGEAPMDDLPTPTRVTAELLGLLRRYDRPGPRYTSYPTRGGIPRGSRRHRLRGEAGRGRRRAEEPLSLYFHLPFCRERCTFCGCSVVITRKPEVVGRYLEYLRTEIELVAARLPHRRTVNQMHWGGGTPTHLDPAGMRALWEEIGRRFTLAPGAEVAIEVDPRVTTHEHVDTLRALASTG